MEKLDDPHKKESHPNKSLATHIEECKELYDRFANFYGINCEYVKKIIYDVITYHDYGKLNHDWSLNKKIPHSNISTEIFFQEKEKELNLNHMSDLYIYLSALLILKHHGKIAPDTAFSDFNYLVEAFNRNDESSLRTKFFKEFDFKKRVNLADAYGLFKIADCLSASDEITFSPKKPDLKEQKLEEFLSDPNRRAAQIVIKNIGAFGFLRAPTGWGKTKSSPYYFVNKDVKKVFFMFPTVTAINKFYNDFKELFGDNIEKYFYFYDTELYNPEMENNTENIESKIFFSRQFLKPYIITTVDQFLLAFLQVGKYHTKRVMFRDSAIILDEVHLLNERMLYLLLHFLKKFKEIYNFKILLMSATLPDGLKRAIEEYVGYFCKENDFVDMVHLYKKNKRIKFSLEHINQHLTEAIDKIVKLSKNKKVLVIANTVEDAVKIKMELEKYSNIKSLLLHSRFHYYKRKEIEEEIEEIEKMKNPHVLVATQVCEVALDISYDYLFTELAPMPSLIQRFGRVNRYGNIKYEDNEDNVFLFKPNIQNEKYYPYEPKDIEKAQKILENLKNLENEFQLFEKFNTLDHYEKDAILDRINKVENDLKIEEIFENTTRSGYFFALELSEKDVQQILDYRESFTTLIIPYGADVIPSDSENASRLRDKIEKLIGKYEKAINEKNSIEEILKIHSQLKGYAVPVPMYTINFGKGVNFEKKFLPIVEKAGDFVYDERYGFIKKSMLE